MLTSMEIEQTVDKAMYDNRVMLCEQDVENDILVYENDWGNWALEQGFGQSDLISIDGRTIEHLECYGTTVELYEDTVRFVNDTFASFEG